MTLTELMPAIHSLDRADKLKLIQMIAADIASDEVAISDFAGKTVPLWSPHDSFQAADTLLQLLNT